jgi:2C-methyl-D-erythritol 2,4-cyclodiphosphate synthase
MEPINYLQQVADPFAQALQGYKIGAGMADIEAKRAQAEQQRLATEKYNQALSRLQSPTATAADFENMIMISGKDQAANIKTVMESRSAQQNQAALNQVSPIAFALKTGNVEHGITQLMQKAEAARNSGDTQDATYLTQLAEQAKTQPENIGNLFASKMVLIPGGKEALDNLLKMIQEDRAAAAAPEELRKKIADADAAVADAKTKQATATNAAEKAAADAAKATADAKKAAVDAQYAERVQLAGLEEKGWNVKNLKSQISDRSARLGLDQQTMQATVAEKLSSIQKNLNEIPADTRKLINESATLAAASKQSANQMNDLAKRIEDLGGYGTASRLGEFAKKTLGAEGYETGLRQEYTRLRNQAGIKSLPPGPATDKDIQLALKGFPEDTSNSKSIASFLRGMAKLQEIDAASNNAKTDWLAQNNGTLTRAGKTFIAGDYTVNTGETFNDFNSRVVTDISKRYRSREQQMEDERAATMAKIPTTGTPAAAPAPVNIRAQADAILNGGR